MCKNESAVTEITLLPVRKFNFDAAIIFSDILIILDCLDIKVDFIKNKGPEVENKDIKKIFKKEGKMCSKKGIFILKRLESGPLAVEIILSLVRSYAYAYVRA